MIHEQLAAIARRGRIPLADVVEERAARSAIREYLGELPRDQAEIAAVADTRDVLGVSS
jgi:hypothetical protein